MRDLKQRLFDLLRSGGISVGENNNNNSNHGNGNGNNNKSNGPQQQQQHQQSQQQQQQQLYSSHHPVQKPKKLHEYTAADCNAAFLRKYHDLSISRARERERELELEPNGTSNVIYFNENLSMTSKYNIRQFPLTRYPSCPLSSFGLSPQRAEGSAGSSLAEDTESDRYNFCSDGSEDQSSSAHTLKLRCHKLHMDTDAEVDADGDDADDADMDGDDLDDDHAESQLDSFCTLCTSTFSYNKCCRFCDNSLCGSKCNSERGSHASRLSCSNRNNNNNNNSYGLLDNELDFSAQQLLHQPHPHPHPHHHPQRFGGATRLHPPNLAAASAIR
ncbi:hypothetical protein AWZ03_013679 [Drosophila navojoa]|uniref:Uncharacterized protein n=1 Tax=Drosophila navojoa TaxID=7232 RepID=A0A484AU12_DRONA|nr:hypothetical protein AWZ03_013679 [Drosophila navojoa]